jgi:Ca-activated chloride channel family protein
MSHTQTPDTPTTSVGWTIVAMLFVAMAPISYVLEFHDAVVGFLAPDITLARPQLLSLLWLVPGLGIWLRQRRHQRTAALHRVIAPHLAAKLTPSVSQGKRNFRGVLMALAWFMLLVTLMGPQWGTQVRIMQRKGIDIIVAIDLSESMLAKDIPTASMQRMQRRLQLARKKVRVLMDLLAGERIGVVAFAGRPVTLCPLTIDHNTCAIWLESFSPSLITQGGTALASTIKHAVPMFSTSGANSRALFLLTDGDDHEKNTKKAAELAKKKGIRIYALGFGSPKMTVIPPEQLPPPPKGEPIDPRPIKTRLNESLLQQVATSTLGQYRRAKVSHQDIRGLYDHARQTLKAQTHKSQRMVFREERFNVFMGIGLLMLLFSWGFSERKDQ